MADGAPPRPEMYQTYAPFVEFYIRGEDVLRSSDGKPRTLIRFQHQRYQMGKGMWELELFDPNFVEIEELMLKARAQEGESSGDEGGNPEDYDLTHPAMFRYGYVSQDGKVISASPGGEEDYFFGSIHNYTPTFQPNGTLLHITGMSMGFYHKRSIKEKRSFYAKGLFDIVKEVCEVAEWTLVPLGGTPDEEEELPLEKQPTTLLVTSASIDSTEEQAPTYTMNEGETYYEFVQRLCMEARANDPKYNDFVCYLETRAKSTTNVDGSPTPGETTTYLYFGPADAFKPPVRRYVYMRDPKSDVISFTPNFMITVAAQAGVTSGMVVKGEDKQRGLMFVHPFGHDNADMKTFRTRRVPHNLAYTLAEMQQFQEGNPELGEDTEERTEGGAMGPTIMVAPKAADVDSPIVEMSLPITEPVRMDNSTMNWWLSMNRVVNNATLVIFGDPSPEITLGNNVLVVYYIPVENKEFRVHYITKIWGIIGVTNVIEGGSFTTQLDLSSNAGIHSSIATRQGFNALTSGMDTGAMNRAGG